LTDEELKRIEEQATWVRTKTDVLALVAEVRRLRGLVKEAETHGERGGDAACPWCDAVRPRVVTAFTYVEPHTMGCPAFNADGSVR
jgi:hypothetical protein